MQQQKEPYLPHSMISEHVRSGKSSHHIMGMHVVSVDVPSLQKTIGTKLNELSYALTEECLTAALHTFSLFTSGVSGVFTG
jgi:hypothetical protein